MIKKVFAILFVFLYVSAYSLFAQTYVFVKHDASGNNDGTSWADAYTTLQQALSAADSGDHIWVAAGTYAPENAVGGEGARFRTFQMKNGVEIYGGFAGSEDTETFNLADRSFEANETILSGAADDVYHIFRHVNLGLNSTAVLDGFTISGGKADGSDPDNKGGGMLNSGSNAGNGSSPTIRNCVFKNNEAVQGGAIFNSRYSSPAIINTVFQNNTASDVGGAVYLVRNTSTFDGCTFQNNTAQATGSAKGGGAVYTTTSNNAEGTTFTNCSFSNNTVDTTSSGARGGAIHASINPGKLTITGSTFQQNEAQYGGAVYVETGNDDFVADSEIVIISSTFEENSAEHGGAIFNERHNTSVTSCLIRGNLAEEAGGGYYSRFGSSKIVNSLISGNRSNSRGGGIYYSDESPEIINTTISGNYSSQRGGGISMINGSTVEIKNSIIWGNASPEGNELWMCSTCTANIDYSLYGNASGDISGGTVNATNSLTVDPKFLNPLAPTSGNTPNILGNYFICGCNSPCVDAGNNDHVPSDLLTDLRGATRIQDGYADGTPTVDLGAYEFDATGCNALAPFVGDGSIENPYEISMIQHLYWAAVDPTRWSYHYIQTDDIDADITVNWFDGDGWSPIGNSNTRFTGTYDGQGYSISNLYINRPDVREVGLFGEIGGTLSDKAILKNITLLNADVTAERQVGALVGRAQQNNDIINCHVSGSVKGTRNVGGLVGHGIRTDFLRCSSSAAVSLIGTNAMYHGGLMGHINNASTVKESFATGNVHGRTRVGGLIGAIGWNSSVEDSYARGNVSSEGLSNPMIGGLVGEVWNAGIRRSYSTGIVETTGLSGDYGGLVGNKTTTSNYFDDDNFWDIEASGLSESEMGTGKTTAQMKDAATFTDLTTAGLDAPWDFVDNPNDDVANDDIWDIDVFVNNGYPSLTWQDFEKEIDIIISGTAGWRMLSIPVEGTRIRDLMDFNELAGFPGANAHYGSFPGYNFEQAQAQNFFFFDPALYDAGQSSPGASEPGWKAPDNADQIIEPGRGFIWFFYDDLPAGESPVSFPLPTVIPLDVTSAPVDPVNVSLTKKSDMSDKDAWNLVGNPYPSAIDPAELEAGNAGLESLAAQIWNSATGSFEVRNFSGESSDIAIGQGFFVENDDLESFTIPGEARKVGIPPLLREQGKSSDGPLILRFRLEGEHDTYDVQTIDEAISLYMSEDATSGWDHYDVQKLTPLSAPYATLSFVGERNGNTIYKAQESQPVNPEKESVEIPVKLTLYYMSGSFALTWDMPPELPESIGLMLLDHHTGDEVSLREASEYRFTAFDKSDKASLLPGQPKSKSEATATSESLPFSKALPVAVSLRETLSKTDDTEYRFGLILKKGPVGSELGPDFPQEVELAQNYPNPFNPVTMLSFGLPENAHVRLAVYDITGRRVAVLLDGDQKAGRHEISWDASHLSSGIYLYRLEADGKSLVRKMTLIK